MIRNETFFMKFTDLGLAEPIVRAVTARGYVTATPIQVQAIPGVLSGRDVLGCARTGTGKTAAFVLPILQRLAHAAPRHEKHRREIRALILCPTRELAMQINESCRAYGRHLDLRHDVITGGVSQVHQVRALRGGLDILIATPGRLLDLASQGHINLKELAIFVLDEADRMLDMGFMPDIRRIIKRLPAKRQTLLFSATMPTDIRKLADSILHDPMDVKVDPETSTVKAVTQTVYLVAQQNKSALLHHLLLDRGRGRTLVFTRTKRRADTVAKALDRAGIAAEALHGNKSQNVRIRALARFKAGERAVLVATDIASRGIDVSDISHVINFDMPDGPETYVHRIGRTARAGASGAAITFCDHADRAEFHAIQRRVGSAMHVAELPEFSPGAAPAQADRSTAPRSEHNRSKPRRASGGIGSRKPGQARVAGAALERNQAGGGARSRWPQHNRPKGRAAARRVR
jgi:ATP-dependent RNA helicase RhlE